MNDFEDIDKGLNAKIQPLIKHVQYYFNLKDIGKGINMMHRFILYSYNSILQGKRRLK